MAKMVPAWDKRTGRKLDYDVPESHLKHFPNVLAGSQQAAAGAQRTAGAKSEKKEA